MAADADNSAFGVSEGDTLTISFDLPTDTGVDPPQPWGSGVGVGVTAGDKDYVDSLFRFCPRSGCGDELRPPGDFAIVVGADYEGAWTDESTFVVTILDAGGSEVALGEGVIGVLAGIRTGPCYTPGCFGGPPLPLRTLKK